MRIGLARRHLLLLFPASAAVWAAVVAIGGGFVLQMPWGRLSSREPIRPLVLGLVLLGVYAARFRDDARAALRSLAPAPWPRIVAAIASLAALAIGIGSGTFVASSADASGYVSQAALWGHGRLTAPVPDWITAAPWPDPLWTVSPLGYRPAPDAQALVPTYAPGLPIMMAALAKILGASGAYVVVPLLGATAVWATYLLGTWLAANAWAGAAASVMLLASPVFLFMLVQPMSDVPCAAFWTLALVRAVRPHMRDALVAGLFATAAVLTRPNLVPLVVMVGVTVMAASSRDRVWRRAAVFTAVASVSVAAIALLNWRWYGSPLQSGYGSLGELYEVRQFFPNVERYSRWLWETQTPLIICFLAAPFAVAAPRPRPIVWLVAIGFPAAVLAMYVLYNPFEEWWYLRFLLPAIPAMLSACAAAIILGARRWLPSRAAGAVAAVVLGAIVVWTAGISRDRGVLTLRGPEQRYRRVAEYTERLPPRSVFAAVIHSGSLRFYTGRDVLRWDAISRSDIERALRYLRDRGHDVYLVAEPDEVEPFRGRFAGTSAARDLEAWPPVIVGGDVIYALAGSRPLPRPD